MELRHLRYFVSVAGELSFTRAAAKLHLAQPSLTRQIHNLEDEIGVRLFDRIKKHVSLTAEGRGFLFDAKRLLELSLESVKSVQRCSRGESSHLNVGYLCKFNFDLLPKTLKAFYQVCPEIALNLFDMPPAAQLRALEERKIDLAFMGLRPPVASHNLNSLIWERVAQHDLAVVLPVHHPLAQKNKIKLLELQSLFFVTLSEETHPGSEAWLISICQEAGFTPKIVQHVESESAILPFVAEGLGVTLARDQIKKLPHSGVVFRPLEASAKVDYWIAWHGENRSKALSQYIEIVKKEVPAAESNGVGRTTRPLASAMSTLFAKSSRDSVGQASSLPVPGHLSPSSSSRAEAR
ncbi:MAG: LysR substrate-binding domain-containing protein [Verrucomicrobiota bacterium]